MYRDNAAPDRSILIAAFNGNIYGIDRTTGRFVWSGQIEDRGGYVEIAIESGMVIACTRTRLAILDYRTGAAIAAVPLVGEYASRPTMVVDQGQILIARNGEVTCYAMNGQPLWFQPFEGLGAGGLALGLPGNVRQADDAGPRPLRVGPGGVVIP